jgi:hypothetical protein
MITIYNEPQYYWHLKMRNKCAYTYRGTGSHLDRSTLKGAGDMAQAAECCLVDIKS